MFPLMILHSLMRKCLTMYFFTYAMTSKETNTFMIIYSKTDFWKEKVKGSHYAWNLYGNLFRAFNCENHFLDH